MSTVTVVLEEIVCRDTTEAGHDEVYYVSPAVARHKGDTTTTDPSGPGGPTTAQAADAGGPGGDNTAWDCNDSGDLSDRMLNVELFSFPIAAGERVSVVLTFLESDGDDLTTEEAIVAGGVQTIAAVVGLAFPPALPVVAIIDGAIGLVSGFFQGIHGIPNHDDPLGSVSFLLDADGSHVRLRQVAASPGGLSELSKSGTVGRAVVRLTGSGADYSLTFRLDGSVTVKPSGLTLEAPLSQDLSPADFAHWTTADRNGATGTWAGGGVRLAGPMGTAFFLHDDYPNFSGPAFTPALASTGMVEISGGAGHSFQLTFDEPITDPVLLIGSLGSLMTFPPDTEIDIVSDDGGLTVRGNVLDGTPRNSPSTPGSSPGLTDSNGTVRLNGIFSEITFTVEPRPSDPFTADGVFFQVGGTRPA